MKNKFFKGQIKGIQAGDRVHVLRNNQVIHSLATVVSVSKTDIRISTSGASVLRFDAACNVDVVLKKGGAK